MIDPRLKYFHIYLFFFFWEMSEIFVAWNRENWQACAAILWMFCPPGLCTDHMTENYELVKSFLQLLLEASVAIETVSVLRCALGTAHAHWLYQLYNTFSKKKCICIGGLFSFIGICRYWIFKCAGHFLYFCI